MQIKFIVRECGNSAEEALYQATKVAYIDYGRGKGTLADRDGDEMKVFKPNMNENPVEHIEELFSTTVKTHEDPIGCLPVDEGEYMFFGWALRDPGEMIVLD